MAPGNIRCERHSAPRPGGRGRAETIPSATVRTRHHRRSRIPRRRGQAPVLGCLLQATRHERRSGVAAVQLRARWAAGLDHGRRIPTSLGARTTSRAAIRALLRLTDIPCRPLDFRAEQVVENTETRGWERDRKTVPEHRSSDVRRRDLSASIHSR